MNKVKMMVMAGLVSVFAVFATVNTVSAVKCPSNMGGGEVSSLAECSLQKSDDKRDLMDTVLTIINVVLAVLGLVSVIMIVVGGIQYTTSAGDAAKTSKAKNTIMYSIIGLIVALLAFAIVNFVLANVFGSGSGGSSNSNSSSSSKESSAETE